VALITYAAGRYAVSAGPSALMPMIGTEAAE
jgi:hypothetical protein